MIPSGGVSAGRFFSARIMQILAIRKPMRVRRAESHRDRAALLLAVALLLVALYYLVPGVLTQTHGDISRGTLLQVKRALFVPLYLFVAAILPVGAGFALLWSERHVTDPRKRRWVRALAMLGAGVEIVALVGGGPA